MSKLNATLTEKGPILGPKKTQKKAQIVFEIQRKQFV